jgi:outer membrane protein OmpA-like peptidoglycan-associated protein
MAATALLNAGAAFAYDIVTVGGKTYANVSGKLYPATEHETRLPNGRLLNHWWAIDFSSYIPPTVNIPKPPPLKVPTVKIATPEVKPAPRQESPIAVRDDGDKHYITISADVLFEFDKAELTPEAEEVLTQLLPVLQKYGKASLLITGHTDSVGSDEYNQVLSEKRAESVKNWIAAHAAEAGAISTAGSGEKSPVAPNTYNDGTDFPQGRAKNRRVEIVVNSGG